MKTIKKVKSLGKTRGATQTRARIKNPDDSRIKGFEKLFLHIDQNQNPYVWTLNKIKNQKLLKDITTLTSKIIETYFDQLYFQIYKFTSKEEKYIVFLNIELPDRYRKNSFVSYKIVLCFIWYFNTERNTQGFYNFGEIKNYQGIYESTGPNWPICLLDLGSIFFIISNALNHFINSLNIKIHYDKKENLLNQLEKVNLENRRKYGHIKYKDFETQIIYYPKHLNYSDNNLFTHDNTLKNDFFDTDFFKK